MAPCIWIINPQETTYILKSILRLASVSVRLPEDVENNDSDNNSTDGSDKNQLKEHSSPINFTEIERRTKAAAVMDVYTGEMKPTM